MDCEIAEFYNEELVEARKEHKCCETGRVIKKGESYWRCTGKWDGEIQTYKQSQSAYHFARHLNSKIYPNEPQECVPFGCIGEDIQEWVTYGVDLNPYAIVWDKILKGELEFGPDDSVNE